MSYGFQACRGGIMSARDIELNQAARAALARLDAAANARDLASARGITLAMLTLRWGTL